MNLFNPRSTKVGNPRSATNDEEALETVTDSPHASLSSVAQQNEISQNYIHRILKLYHHLF